MNPDEAVTFIEARLERPLNDTQRALLRGVVQGKSYKEIHHEFPSCSLEHLSRNVGPALWKLIGQLLGAEVRKNTVIGAIERAIAAQSLRLPQQTKQGFQARGSTLPWRSNLSPSEPDTDELETNGSTTSGSTTSGSKTSGLEDSGLEVDELDTPEFDSTEFDSTEILEGFPQTSIQQNWAEAPDMRGLCGRQQELDELEQRIRLDNCRLLVVCGVAGIGKSLLVSKLAHRVRDHFESLVWMSMTAQPPLLLENCLAELMVRLTDGTGSTSQTEQTPGGTHASLPVATPLTVSPPTVSTPDVLSHLFQHDCLIVLDGFEMLMQRGVHDGSYVPGYESYRELLEQVSRTAHRSCVIVITRELPAHIRRGESRDRHSLTYPLAGLKPLEGQELLEHCRLYAEDSSTWLRFVQQCEGNPLILQIAAEQSDLLFDGNATESLKHLQPLMFPEVQRLLAEQMKRLSAGEAWVLRSLLSPQPSAVGLDDLIEQMQAIPDSIEAQMLLKNSMGLLEILQSLIRRSLVNQSEGRYAIAPMLRQYLSP